jgi:hypothetical protein
MNKNAALTVSSASGVLAADEVPTIISGPTKSEESFKGAINFTRMRPSLWDAVDVLQVFAGSLAVLYLAGAVALGVALLFYTFAR